MPFAELRGRVVPIPGIVVDDSRYSGSRPPSSYLVIRFVPRMCLPRMRQKGQTGAGTWRRGKNTIWKNNPKTVTIARIILPSSSRKLIPCGQPRGPERAERDPEFKARFLNFFDGSISRGDSTRPMATPASRRILPTFVWETGRRSKDSG